MNIGSTAATPLRTPLIFTSTIWCQSSVFSEETGEFDDCGTVGRLGDVQLLVNRLTTVLRDLVGDLPQLVFASCAEDDLGALARQQLRGRLADAG